MYREYNTNPRKFSVEVGRYEQSIANKIPKIIFCDWYNILYLLLST